MKEETYTIGVEKVREMDKKLSEYSDIDKVSYGIITISYALSIGAMTEKDIIRNVRETSKLFKSVEDKNES